MNFYDMFSDYHQPTPPNNKKKRFLTPMKPDKNNKNNKNNKDNKDNKKNKHVIKKAPSASVSYGNFQFKKIKTSKEGATKYDAVFVNLKTNKEKIVSFGSRTAKFYPDIKDKNYKEYILKTHPLPENIDLMSRKALERYILWNKKDIKSSVESYKKLLKSKSSEK